MNEFEFTQETSDLKETNESSDVRASINPGMLGYSVTRIAAIPEVKEKINDVKEDISEVLHDAKESVVEFGEKVKDGLKDFCANVYENVKDYFTDAKSIETRTTQWSREFSETREFGLQECSDAAIRIFTPEVIDNWGTMSKEQRTEIATSYANEVAKAFELANYTGVIIEELEPGVGGYNNGDGSIHISNDLIGSWTTPFEIMDTITHELRHQYQNECVRGYHDVSDEVRNEWAVASEIYNYDQPSCYDPWGYTYNPLEIDSRYAGETVVRNVTNQLFNDLIA